MPGGTVAFGQKKKLPGTKNEHILLLGFIFWYQQVLRGTWNRNTLPGTKMRANPWLTWHFWGKMLQNMRSNPCWYDDLIPVRGTRWRVNRKMPQKMGANPWLAWYVDMSWSKYYSRWRITRHDRRAVNRGTAAHFGETYFWLGRRALLRMPSVLLQCNLSSCCSWGCTFVFSPKGQHDQMV